MPDSRAADLGFAELIFSDFHRYRAEAAPTWLRVLLLCLKEPGMIASIILRAQRSLSRAGHRRGAALLRTLGVLVVGADFVPGMSIGKGLLLPHPVGIVMGNDTVIGNHVTIAQGVTLGARIPDATIVQEFPRIGDGAILLANATVVGGVVIGKHAQVGANSLVLADVPDFAVVIGVPARKIGTREQEASTSGLLPPEARPVSTT